MTDLKQLFLDVLREHGTGYLIDEFECCAEELANLFIEVDGRDAIPTFILKDHDT